MKNLSKQLTKIFQVRNYNLLQQQHHLKIKIKRFLLIIFFFFEKAENNIGSTYIYIYIYIVSKNNSYPVCMILVQVDPLPRFPRVLDKRQLSSIILVISKLIMNDMGPRCDIRHCNFICHTQGSELVSGFWLGLQTDQVIYK